MAHCVDFLEEAGMMDAVRAAGFQLKNGAAFAWGERETFFNFDDRFTPGPATTFEVPRGEFDKVLADDAQRQGVPIRYEHEVTATSFSDGEAQITARPLQGGAPYQLRARFVLDASGYGRVLPRLLNLEAPSSLAKRRAVFTHIQDNIVDEGYDRNKILITIHPEHRDIWYWLIPFSNGRCSIGVVGELHYFEEALGKQTPLDDLLKEWVACAPKLKRLLKNAQWDTPARTLEGYSANVKQLHGTGYALLGNAAEFLDPVFSSGVTIAMCSASLAAKALARQLRGEAVDWDEAYTKPLMVGVNCFRTYVNGWYDGGFQDVIFYENAQPEIRRMICAILAGYAWDANNPFVAESERRLQMVVRTIGSIKEQTTGR